MKRHLGIFLRGAGMGAADAVPGVSGGTIAFVTGIYEELIHSIKQFGPSAYVAWRRGGLPLLVAHLNLTFVLPLLAGIAISLISVAHLVVWLLDDFPLLLDGFFFGLVAASAVVVSRHPADWQWWHLLPLVGGLLLAHGLPSLMPLVTQLGSPDLVLVVGSKNSSNSVRLTEISENAGTKAARIDDVHELTPAMLDGVQTLVLTSGASAPDHLVKQIVAHLKMHYGAELEEDQLIEEDMHFNLPKQLRVLQNEAS